MANTTPSIYMTLQIPVVGEDPSPTWAQDVNACIIRIDAHNHTSGSGQTLDQSALNITGDVAFNGNAVGSLKAARFIAQSSPFAGSAPNLGAIYVSGVDLYYNDINGNQVRLTAAGSPAGSSGSITNLPTGGAVYSTGTITFQNSTALPANLDFGSAVLRNNASGSKGLTLRAPAAMASDYTLVLPPLPVGVTKIMALDTSGNITAAYTVDGATIVISGNVLTVGPNSIGATQIGSNAITAAAMQANSVANASIQVGAVHTANLDPGNIDGATILINHSVPFITRVSRVSAGAASTHGNFAVSTSSGSYSNATTTYSNINSAINVTTDGGTPRIRLQSDGGGSASYIAITADGSGNATAIVRCLRGATEIAQYQIGQTGLNPGALLYCPTSSFECNSFAAAGSYNFQFQARCLVAASVSIPNTVCIADEY